MPANKNALTRIVLLDKLLADRYHAYSIQDMTDYLERELPNYGKDGGVSKRCVEKDIEYLEMVGNIQNVQTMTTTIKTTKNFE